MIYQLFFYCRKYTGKRKKAIVSDHPDQYVYLLISCMGNKLEVFDFYHTAVPKIECKKRKEKNVVLEYDRSLFDIIWCARRETLDGKVQ